MFFVSDLILFVILIQSGMCERSVPDAVTYTSLGTRDHDSTADSNSRRSSSDAGHRDWEAERKRGRSLKVWKRPVVRQYFHKGLLWRSSELQEVASYELFVDLLYVGIIAIIGDSAAEDPTGSGLLKFIIVFSIGWKIWSDIQIVTSWLGKRVQIRTATSDIGYGDANAS